MTCRHWNSSAAVVALPPVVRLTDADAIPVDRYDVGPWSRVFGGGLARTSTVLFGGEAGAGKTTSLLQLCDAVIGQTGRDVILASAEQAPSEVRDTAERLELPHRSGIVVVDLMGTVPRQEVGYLLRDVIVSTRPAMCVVDSVPQIMGRDDQGAVELCTGLKPVAVREQCPIVFIDHITKEHTLAGLMKLQHIADTVMILETGDAKDKWRRVWKTLKNRFGPNAVACFAMTAKGLAALPCGEGDLPCSFCGEKRGAKP